MKKFSRLIFALLITLFAAVPLMSEKASAG